MYEVFENDLYVFLIMELLKGGELYDKLKFIGAFQEDFSAKLMFNMLSALSYAHSLDIIHRDLKPENLIIRSKDDDTDIVIADFGLADYFDPTGEYTFKRCGTPGYVAPEVLADKKYGTKVDAFSAGVIMFIILTGTAPFKGKSYDEIVIKNYKCIVNF